MSFLPYAVAAWLFFVGLYGVVTSRSYIHLAVCLSVLQSSTYVVLLAVGYKNGGTAPIFKGIGRRATTVDPIVQALTLTDIVVGVVVLALILALAMDVFERAQTVDPDQVHELRG